MKNLGAIVLIAMSMACKTGEPAACIDASKINKDAICTMIYKPVCGCDDKTYANECLAENSGVISWTQGACAEK